MTNNELKIMVNNFEKCTGIHFRNKKLLCVALSHSSYAHENNTQSNERLEFLGDSVLGLVISERLYNDSTLAAEGKLSQMRSNIVSEKPLAFGAGGMEKSIGRAYSLESSMMISSSTSAPDPGTVKDRKQNTRVIVKKRRNRRCF